jgi:Uma2 family endonuclease
MRTDSAKKLFTVDEYYRMDAFGILFEGVRTELIKGEVIERSPMRSRYAAAVSRVSHRLVSSLEGKALLRVQLPLRLNVYNEPQPDLAFVRVRRDFYEFRHPGHSDIFLALEISDTSLDYDHDVKAGVYAAARVPEYWVLDLVGSALLVFRGPARGDYKIFMRFQPGDSVSMLAFPEIEIAVSDLLGN